ncbi:hypothetical protein LINPERPRIM_LOCUS5116 [Linum perenne]
MLEHSLRSIPPPFPCPQREILPIFFLFGSKGQISTISWVAKFVTRT